MTPLARLRAAVQGKVPDRVPVVPKVWVDLGAALTGTPLERVIEDPATALRVIVRAAREVGADAARQFHFPPRRTERRGGVLLHVDQRGRRMGRIDLEGGLQTELDEPTDFRADDPLWMAFSHFYHGAEPFVRGLEDAARIAVPSRAVYRELGWAERQREVVAEVGDDLALIGDCSSATLAFCVALRGMERAMFDLVERPELVHALMEKGAAIAAEKGKLAIDLGLEVLRLNDSVANMSVISPRHWREFILPHMRDVCTELHRYSREALVYCHICGNVLPVLEDIVATGVDCIGPLDPLGGFTAAQARAMVGDRVALMGGVDTQTFVRGSEAEVESEARACMAGAAAGGGFVLGSGCVIPRTARRENLVALARAAAAHGRYEGGRLAEAGDR
jgi:hypothetical protein